MPMRLNLSSPDLYIALGIERNAHEDTIREYVGALYREALANADHSDPSTRHYYIELMQVVPRGYSIFLDPAKRARYDQYLQACAEGYQENFEQFSAEQGQSDNHNLRDREGLLSIRTISLQNPLPVQGAPEYSGADSQPMETEAEKSVFSASQSLPVLAGFGSGLVALVAARGALHWPLPKALMLAAIVVIVVFIGFYFRLRFSSRSST